MKHYTKTIPLPLAQRLKAAGMPNIEGKDYFREPTFAEVFDWLLDKAIAISLYKLIPITPECSDGLWNGLVDGEIYRIYSGTWHEAAVTCIEIALDIIKTRKEERK